MKIVRTFFGFTLGAILSAILLWAIVSTISTSNLTRGTSSDQLRRLTIAMDFDGTQKYLLRAHVASLDGKNDFADLRDLFRVFQSTAPEMREFTESWLDEMPESPYALTALTWSLYTAGRHMRGQNLAQLTYLKSMIGFNHLHERADRLARRAYEIAPDLIPASDAVTRQVLTRGKNSSEPSLGVGAQTAILSKVMLLTPNRAA